MRKVDSLWERCRQVQRRLDGNEVHVWFVLLQPSSPLAESLNQLSDYECDRAKRFRFKKDYEHFVRSHVALRAILGGYLGAEPGTLRFSFGAHGKPALAKPYEGSLKFNLSRSHGVALYAVSSGAEVGIDIERIDHAVEADELAERYFAPAESAHIRRLNSADKPRVFLNYWVSKEAYVKATGEGLAFPLNTFEVSLSGKPGPIGMSMESREVSRWSLNTLDGLDGYVAAVVTDGACSKVTHFHWPFPGLAGSTQCSELTAGVIES